MAVSYLKIQVFRLYPDSILTGDNQKHHWQPKKFLRWALKLREWINDGAQLGTKLEILLHVFPKIPADHPPNFVMLIVKCQFQIEFIWLLFIFLWRCRTCWIWWNFVTRIVLLWTSSEEIQLLFFNWRLFCFYSIKFNLLIIIK